MTTALQQLHFKAFLKENESALYESILQDLYNFKNIDESLPIKPELLNLINQYMAYKNETLSGNHGKMAQYWCLYFEIFAVYRSFVRSIRSSSFEGYIESLVAMCSLFYIFNQNNYARYLVKYIDNLKNIESLYPGLKTHLSNGGLGIKRTTKQFSRIPIDLTLEQTINADASNRFTGISALTNNTYARERWAKSHSLRTQLISNFLISIGMEKNDDAASDLRESNIKNNLSKMEHIMTVIEDCANPFAEKMDLINIATGKAATPAIESFLLNVFENGKTQLCK